MMPPGLVLASASRSRQVMLKAAGLDFDVIPSPIDEMSLKISIREQNVRGIALARQLAAAKAQSVSRPQPDAFVIGADQILLFNGKEYDKPENMMAAKHMLRELRGHTHELVCAVCVARAGEIVWQYDETTRLRMWDFSDAFLDDYLTSAGPEILASVGAYHLEGLGAQLFTRVEGDYFTILGLPLLPLLTYLRTENVLPS